MSTATATALSEYKSSLISLDRIVKQFTGTRPYSWTPANVMWAQCHEGTFDGLTNEQWAEIESVLQKCLRLEAEIEG